MWRMHLNVEDAKETITRRPVVSEDPKVMVLIAHDYLRSRFNEYKDKCVVFPGKIPPKV